MTRAIVICFICLISFAGCSAPPEDRPDNDFILKSEFIRVSTDDFLDELELKKAAYPYNLKDNPEEYNEMIISLVQMLTEEVVLLSAASQNGIAVSAQELDQAVTEFKKDYPEDSFDQILLENAISYPFWKERFKKHMIMDRLIDSELRQKIEITADDIVQFYRQYRQKEAAGSTQSKVDAVENENELVSRLRLQKTQEKYDDWIKDLTNQYPVVINNEKLKDYLLKTNKSRKIEDEQ